MPLKPSLAACFCAALLLAQPAAAQKLPRKKAVLKVMTLTNNYFMAKWPDTGKEIVTNKARPSHIWTRLMSIPPWTRREAQV